MYASKGTTKIPPKNPSEIMIIAHGIIIEENPCKRERAIAIANKAAQDSPKSTSFRHALPATVAPIAIPIAHPKNMYPPPTSLRWSDCIANGMMLSCKKAPIKRKKADPYTAIINLGLRAQNFKVLYT